MINLIWPWMNWIYLWPSQARHLWYFITRPFRPWFLFGSSPYPITYHPQKFSLPIDQLLLIDSTLKKSKLGINALQLFKFMSKCIAARESSKFYFTKYLSSSLEALAEIGNQFGYSRDDATRVIHLLRCFMRFRSRPFLLDLLTRVRLIMQLLWLHRYLLSNPNQVVLSTYWDPS